MEWEAGKEWGAFACKSSPQTLLQGMFQGVRKLSEALTELSRVGRGLCELLSALLELSKDEGNLQARVTELERSRERWEATVEADAIRSDSTFKAARGAEERTRTMRRHVEALSGSDEGEADEALKAVRELLETDGAGGTPPELQTVPENMVVDPKALGRKAKFG